MLLHATTSARPAITVTTARFILRGCSTPGRDPTRAGGRFFAARAGRPFLRPRGAGLRLASLPPARRAFEADRDRPPGRPRPVPPALCSISSRTNSPACVEGALPSARPFFARSTVSSAWRWTVHRWCRAGANATGPARRWWREVREGVLERSEDELTVRAGRQAALDRPPIAKSRRSRGRGCRRVAFQ